MKYTLPKQILLALSFLIIVFACQEENILNNSNDELDEDMLAASYLTNQYLGSIGARTDGETAITVLRYENGQLLYSTNTDTVEGYQVVSEETVTASLEPGEFMFWYSGGGLSHLNGIDFDDSSQEVLGDLPSEINPDLLWTITLPEVTDSTQQYLKYDIIYQFEGNTGPPIRLDPKIKVGGQVTGGDVEDGGGEADGDDQ